MMRIKFINKIFIVILNISVIFFSSCEKLLDPVDTNPSTSERLFRDRDFAEGLLLRGYTGWLNNYNLDEVATDDAVSNVRGSSYRRMATGEWSALYNPISVWNSAYQSLYYLNYFLSISNDILYAWDDRQSSAEERTRYYKQKFTGEAKLLRAWYNFELLKNHGGIASDNTPQGFIIMKDVPDKNKSNLPRDSYEVCVQFILQDIQDALNLLPLDYADRPGDVAYNTVFGNLDNKNQGRVNGRFAKALRSRVLLHVASMPFYTVADKWEVAAEAAAELLNTNGGGIAGISGMASNGVNFWRNDASAEILFKRAYFESNSREVANFPPSRFGAGQTNPSQNLVDAFPMANGFPINHELSGYNAENPYLNRDPRLATYIVFNGGEINNVIVHTHTGDPKDGLNQQENSTRTGYYLKKLLQPAVNLNPTVMSTQRNFYTLFRYTEIFLNYAEAANEAWGPDADPNGYGFTPKSIIAAIRKRAGIIQPDEYLESIANKDDLRKIIQNERRLELCFEGFRFWDMRRWGLNLTETVKGIEISNNVYKIIPVEERKYQPYMRYGAIPYQETLKSKLTLQNSGW